MKKGLIQITVEYFKNFPKNIPTAKEIAQWIVENEKDFCSTKMKTTKAKTKELLLNQLRAEITSHSVLLEKRGIFRTADKPKRFYYINEKENINKEEKEVKKRKEEVKLYPKLAQYCKSINIETLRIDEKASKKLGKNYNEWLHADVVGYKDLTKKFNAYAKECLVESSGKRGELYSFEVKDGIISRGELREYFFQAVSNSSWANYSYLVAEGIDDKAKEELQLLCSSFKIGFIQLDKLKPLESDITIQAPKTELDWNMINRIADVNKDFQKYLKNISLSYKKHSNNDIQTPKWDIEEKNE